MSPEAAAQPRITGELSMQKHSTKAAVLAASAFGALVALPLIASAAPAPTPTFQAEKCYGINAAGKNDCAATGSNSCAGQGKQAMDPKGWVYVPVGTCSK